MSGFYRAVLQLLKPFWLPASLGILAGALTAFATGWLLASVNRGLQAPGGISTIFLAQFAMLSLLCIFGGAVSGIANTSAGQKIVAKLRKDVAKRILDAPVSRIEHYGSHRLLVILTTDIDLLGAFALQFSGLVIAFATAVGSFGYLLALSWRAFVFCIIAVALGIGIGFVGRRGWMNDYERIRSTEDELRKHYRAITEGAKELRLNRARRNRVRDQLLSDAIDHIAMLRTLAMRRLWIVDACAGVLFFGMIGILLWFHGGSATGAAGSGSILVLLFARGPIEQIITVLPQLGQAETSFRRIAAVSAGLDIAAAREPRANRGNSEWGQIELRDAHYTYEANGANSPVPLGPFNVRIRRGEIVFVVGENGSGKTTLIKLLLGLYAPDKGTLLLDGKPIPPNGLDTYRQMISAVFSDYFLFEDIPPGTTNCSTRARRFLERLGIAHKVGVEAGVFTTTALSTGERKRLALVQALLEDRPIIMCDEWTADQDPTFRRIFYAELLPDLKKAGKTLIVVSHDDRHFGMADKLIRLRDGKMDMRSDALVLAPDLSSTEVRSNA